MACVVPQDDVLLQVYAFLESCGYTRTILALQAESGVPYNVIHAISQAPSARRVDETPRSVQELEKAVLEGNWFEVLSRYVHGLLLPQDVKEALYETVFEELLDLHGLREAARALLSHSPVFKEMKSHAPARHARLETILQHFNDAAVEERAAARASTPAEVQGKREAVLRQLLRHIHFSSEPYDGFLPAALAAHRMSATAIVDASSSPASPSDPTPTRAAKRPREDEATPSAVSSAHHADPLLHMTHPVEAPSSIDAKITLGDDAVIGCCTSLPGASTRPPLALLGHANGVLDFVDPSTGRDVGAAVGHTAGVLALAVDCPPNQPAWVAVGYRDGTVKVYNAETRKLVRRFPTVHALGVTCLSFLGSTIEEGLTGHHGLLVTGSFDTTMHVLSLSQGSSLCQVRGGHHDAFINAVCVWQGPNADPTRDCAYFLSAGNDGMLCAWRLERSFASGATARCQRLREGTTALHALYKPARDAIPTSLLVIPPTQVDSQAIPQGTAGSSSHISTTATEVAVLTRSHVVLVLSLRCRADEDDSEDVVSYTVLCAVDVRRPVRFGACLLSRTATLTVPLLSLYVTDAHGTILLFNVEMHWRDADAWSQRGGGQCVTQCTSQSTAVIVDVGSSVHDLHVACFPRTPESAKVRVVAWSPSLHCAYLLH